MKWDYNENVKSKLQYDYIYCNLNCSKILAACPYKQLSTTQSLEMVSE